MLRLSASLLAFVCFTAPLVADAQPGYPPPPVGAYGHPYAQPPGYHAHDGFLLRFSIGLGGINQTALSRLSGEITTTGAGIVGVYDVAIGGIIARNTALHFTGFGFGVPKEADVPLPAGGSLVRLRGVAGAGVGVTHYTASNLYVTGAVGVGALMVSTLGGPDESGPKGFATQIGVGKEWWASANWGVGLSGLLGFARASHEIGAWNTLWMGVAFSATYN